MCTDHQFLLMSSPPAKERAFREAKTKHGSTFAFHGSQVENWHSIMRKGLVNASGTKFQVNGAAYGKGIYLSPMASTSFNYSGARSRVSVKSGGRGGVGITCTFIIYFFISISISSQNGINKRAIKTKNIT